MLSLALKGKREMLMDKLIVSPSPHIRRSQSTAKIMSKVLLALMPAVIAATVIFGGRALMLISICMGSAIIWERLANIVMKREDTTHDLSAAVTGMILGLNLPQSLPFWMAVLGSFIAIVIVKQLFGGLGHNFANPALVGRIVLFVSFPSAMTAWVDPFTCDATTSATPLITKSANMVDLFFGAVRGSLGETCSLALLIGGCLLVLMKVITPTIPLAYIGTVAGFSYLAGEDPLYQVLSGGLLLGAIFMATDYVTSPVTESGKLIFGIGCGVITCVIRFYGSNPEGVSFAILIMNIVTPYIEMLTATRPIGAKKAKKEQGANT